MLGGPMLLGRGARTVFSSEALAVFGAGLSAPAPRTPPAELGRGAAGLEVAMLAVALCAVARESEEVLDTGGAGGRELPPSMDERELVREMLGRVDELLRFELSRDERRERAGALPRTANHESCKQSYNLGGLIKGKPGETHS